MNWDTVGPISLIVLIGFAGYLVGRVQSLLEDVEAMRTAERKEREQRELQEYLDESDQVIRNVPLRYGRH